MAKKSWHLDRRTFIKGLGAACMLPYMECMSMNPLVNLVNGKSESAKRLCFLYFPNGVSTPPVASEYYKDWNWFPKNIGESLEFTKSLSPLENYKNKVSVLGGLSHPKSRALLGHIAGDTWLTAGDLRTDYNNSISIDQVAAQELGKYTRYPSLSLSTDGGVGYNSRVSTLSFDASGKPIPSEHRQREIFERYFSPTNNGASSSRRKSIQQGKKIVDLILEDSKSLNKKLGYNDKSKLDEYLTSLNKIEEQVKRNEQWLDIPMKDFDASQLNLNVDASIDPQAYIRSTIDLMVLAFQTDLTRVITYMIAREDGLGIGDNFPKLALNFSGHHSMSHDKSKGHWAKWGAYDQWLSSQFAYFLDRMENTHDEYGSLLDNTLILYGSACSSTHNANNSPLILAGGKRLGVKHGKYTMFDEKHEPLANLFVSMLNKVGINRESFADSTGKLKVGI